jgi:hypothetical protein
MQQKRSEIKPSRSSFQQLRPLPCLAQRGAQSTLTRAGGSLPSTSEIPNRSIWSRGPMTIGASLSHLGRDGAAAGFLQGVCASRRRPTLKIFAG